ncbi:hypothetical protein CAPTEDRAFT_184037 [Capitella teleta]|uniref:N-acyl-aliphatic-L-amino acid amidohydrolase n=1 Tax=Capitella teleta TaxID=283909 RepID=R7TAZ0_CAPTE|nr:hypothetical protein CAPTEDRAFT_184037 [Capitella teleta]|eukprot:ELT90864.1 hypothetical protein CAPTEDRAFT_184037 [Capitella teleta]
MSDSMTATENQATANFREYLRVNTMQPNPDYAGAADFLTRMANELGLPYQVHECVPGKPIFIITWEGTDPSLPSLLLNSHIDVVPVFPEFWKYEPFSAEKDSNGDIYARGSQDMKCVGIQYIEAIRRIKASGHSFPRTIHMSFVPDEEIGGHDGMEKFILHAAFKKLNVGFALDEGLANPTENFTVFYGERSPWWIEVTCPGAPGHGSRFVENDAGTKMRKIIDSFMDYRENQKAKMEGDPKVKLGDVTTVNFTMVEGGVQMNVIPSELKAKFDVRVTPHQNLEEFEAMLNKWCQEAGEGVAIKFLQKNTNQALTSISSEDPWWKAFSGVCDKLNLSIEPEIFPAATDSRYLRAEGIPAIGFSPMNKTPILLHDHNEYLNEGVFLRGIEIYEQIIPTMASV